MKKIREKIEQEGKGAWIWGELQGEKKWLNMLYEILKSKVCYEIVS